MLMTVPVMGASILSVVNSVQLLYRFLCYKPALRLYQGLITNNIIFGQTLYFLPGHAQEFMEHVIIVLSK